MTTAKKVTQVYNEIKCFEKVNNSQNVLKLHDWFIEDAKSYLVFDRFAQGHLKKYMRKYNKYNQNEYRSPAAISTIVRGIA